MARIAIFGGSFNPPHVVHGMVSAWIRWTRAADEVWFVPVFRHAFEGVHDKVLAPFDLRVGWCEAMVRDLGAGFAVCAIESRLPAPSYTIDTLRALRSEHPEHTFRLVVGADVIPALPRWRDWDSIAAEFDPLVVGRVGYELPQGVETPLFPGVSSSEIRERLAKGMSVQHLLTRSVLPLLDAGLFPGPD